MTHPQVFAPEVSATVSLRTCIATRQRLPQRELLRVVATYDDDGVISIQPDPKRRMPGRGAWITPTVQAWEIAHKRRAFGRALKVSASADASSVRDYLEKTSRADDKGKT